VAEGPERRGEMVWGRYDGSYGAGAEGQEGQTWSVAEEGPVKLYPMIPASSESVYERIPRPAETRAIFLLHVFLV
jgi:hypothetical protein